MSVVVLGMEYPENCKSCSAMQMREFVGPYCPFLHDKVHGFPAFSTEQWDKKDERCPLRPLPEKHGRLIDGDALVLDVRENSESYFADDFVKQWMDYQPTIVEVED